MKSVIFFLLICSLFAKEDIFKKLSAPVEDGDLAFLRALNNYYGCKTWIDGQCTECSQHYVFNDNQICRKVTPQCQKFNRAVGICQQCYLGYEIYNGQCILSNIAESIDRGCRRFQNGKCVQCSIKWFFDSENICQPIDDNCRIWEKNGKCLGCYTGYALKNGLCKISPVKDVANIDSFCAEWDNLSCQKCAERAYFGPIGFCIPVSDYCRTWDTYDGYCLTCYKGYTLDNGECIESQVNKLPPSDLGCKSWDWEHQICLQCSQRWVFNAEGSCFPVSDDCKHYDFTGNCIECYKGYDIEDGKCVFSEDNLKGPTDIGCKLWDWQNQICLQCSERWTFNYKKQCIPVSDQCKEYDDEGKCTDCYRGYDLSGGQCSLSPTNHMQPRDPGCKIWDWESMTCIECSFRWYFGTDGKCLKVNEYCKDFNEQGECTECYKGYALENDECVEVKNDHCAKRQYQECVLCYEGYRVLRGECVPSNPLCKTINEVGHCLSCFSTYVLYHNICVPLVKLVNLARYYAECCPDKLQQLKRQGRIL